MGWTTMCKPPSVKGWFTNSLTWETETHISRPLATSVSLTEAYAAVERLEKATGHREVWAAVYMLRHYRGDDPYNFGYKAMTEDCGPYLTNCPGRILDLLTPTQSLNATTWRRECRDRIRRREALRGISAGAVVTIDEPLSFDGIGRSRVFVYQGRIPTRRGQVEAFRPVLLGHDGHPHVGSFVAIRRWRDRPDLDVHASDRVAEVFAAACAEDRRRVLWAEALRHGAGRSEVVEAWLEDEARRVLTVSSPAFELRTSLTNAGLADPAREAAEAAIASRVDLLSAAPSELIAELRPYWTPDAFDRHMADDCMNGWARTTFAKVLARRADLEPPQMATPQAAQEVAAEPDL